VLVGRNFVSGICMLKPKNLGLKICKKLKTYFLLTSLGFPALLWAQAKRVYGGAENYLEARWLKQLF